MTGFESPNYTMTPNDLFDRLMADMRETELKVVLYACRQTFGYHRETDLISLSQFEKATGLSRQGVIDGIEAAKERGLLEECGVGPRGIKRYRLRVSSVDRSTEETGTSQLSRPVPVNSVDTQKKGNKGKKDIAPGGATREKDTVPASRMNPMKDAIAAAFGWDWKHITRANAGMIQRVAKDLCDAGVEPNEVQAIYNWCKAQGWPGTFTPMALSKHLASWRAQSRPKPNQTVGMAGVVQWVTADDPAPWEVAR